MLASKCERGIKKVGEVIRLTLTGTPLFPIPWSILLTPSAAAGKQGVRFLRRSRRGGAERGKAQVRREIGFSVAK